MILSLQQLQRPLRFGLVGLSGVVVNTTLLWTLARGAQLPVPLASVLATEAAILSNFLLNDRWTFRAVARRHPPLIRLARFNGVSLGGMAITVALLTLLSSYAGLHLLLANMLAIGGAMSWNYFVNSRWTWRGTTTDDRRPTTDEVLVETGLRRQETGEAKQEITDDRQLAADAGQETEEAKQEATDKPQRSASSPRWSVTGGRWSEVNGRWSVVSGRWSEEEVTP
jgi:putative flippase GtrA